MKEYIGKFRGSDSFWISYLIESIYSADKKINQWIQLMWLPINSMFGKGGKQKEGYICGFTWKRVGIKKLCTCERQRWVMSTKPIPKCRVLLHMTRGPLFSLCSIQLLLPNACVVVPHISYNTYLPYIKAKIFHIFKNTYLLLNF